MTEKEAIKIVMNQTPIETIINSFSTPEYYDILGECGGDILRYRVYKKTGAVYEK